MRALTPRSDAARSVMKIRRLQPARRPSAPMKILYRVDGVAGAGGGGLGGSAGVLSCAFGGRFIESSTGALLE